MAFNMAALPAIPPNLTPEQLQAVQAARAQLLSMSAATGQNSPPTVPEAPAAPSSVPPSLGRIILDMLHPPPGGQGVPGVPASPATPPIAPPAVAAPAPVGPPHTVPQPPFAPTPQPQAQNYFPIDLNARPPGPPSPMTGQPAPVAAAPKIGESLVSKGMMNPFSQEDQEVTRDQDRSPPTTEGQKIEPAVIEERKKGWKGFIERFKTDPNLRLALFQSALALTQPSDSAPEAIGNALKVGVGTLDALGQRGREQGREDREESREERKVKVTESGIEQRSKEFAEETEQARKDYELRVKQLESNEAYQRELLKIRRIEATNGGSEGQVNHRWTRLRDAMLADPTAELAAIADPQARKNRAELVAFELINKSGQTRERFVADYLADQQLFLPDPQKDPQGYATGMQELVQRAHTLASTAGLSETRAVPGNAPASTGTQTPAPVQTQAPGAPVRLNAETADQEYAQLPSGAQFIDPNGILRRKP